MERLLIRGGLVIDGTGSPARLADILIHGDRIEQIGDDIETEGAATIDAAGAFVTPGFIDSHTHYDPGMFWDPLLEMAQHGVTSILIGNCALGLAPLHPSDRAATADLFAFIEDIPRGVFDSLVPWNWQTFAEYCQSMRHQASAVNVAALVSHSMLRQYVMGPLSWERAANEAEAERIAEELRIAIDAGAVGLSTSFYDLDAHGRKVPSFYADDAEFDRLFKVVSDAKGLVQVIPQHPDIPQVCEDLKRLGRFSARYGVPVLSNAIGDLPTMPEFAPAMIACAREVNEAGGKLRYMLSPRSIEFTINFDQTMTFATMPIWNGIVQADRSEKRARLSDRDWRGTAREEWDTIENVLFPTAHLDRIRVTEVGRPDYEQYVGMTLADLVQARAAHPSDVLADWLLENEFETRFVVPTSNLDPHRVGKLAQEPSVVLSASDAGAHLQMLCGVGDTTLILTRHVREYGHLSVEEAVRKLTSEQADLIGLNERGRLAPGHFADITIFDLDELQWQDQVVVKDIPGGLPRFARPPGNFKYTIVGGKIVQSAGKGTGELPGQVIVE